MGSGCRKSWRCKPQQYPRPAALPGWSGGEPARRGRPTIGCPKTQNENNWLTITLMLLLYNLNSLAKHWVLAVVAYQFPLTHAGQS